MVARRRAGNLTRCGGDRTRGEAAEAWPAFERQQRKGCWRCTKIHAPITRVVVEVVYRVWPTLTHSPLQLYRPKHLDVAVGGLGDPEYACGRALETSRCSPTNVRADQDIAECSGRAAV